MLALLNGDDFRGLYRDGFALSHAQVSEKPFNFFVTHRSFRDTMPDIICNLKILERIEPYTVPEACLSYPHRPPIKLKRFWRVIVEYDEPTQYLGWHPGGLKTEQRAFDGLVAQMLQHEFDHAHGTNIYAKR